MLLSARLGREAPGWRVGCTRLAAISGHL